MQMFRLIPGVALLAILADGTLAGSVVDVLQTDYRAAGAAAFSADAGKAAWTRENVVAGSNGPRSCSGCHGNDLTKEGKHLQTQKTIAAMAPSVNPKRLTDRKKVEKWLQRNCKWTWGRECTPQEKGDILAYLSTL